MKVQELISLLEDQDPQAEVAFGYSSGDYWGTQIAETADKVGEAHVHSSAYHNGKWKVDNTDDEDEFYDEQDPTENEPVETVVLIQA